MDSIKLTSYAIILVLGLFAFSNAQQTDGKDQYWVRIVSANEDLVVSFPNDFSVLVDKEAFDISNPNNSQESYKVKSLRSISAYQNGASMWLESYDLKNADKAFSFFVATSKKEGKAKSHSIKSSSIKEFVFEKGVFVNKLFFHTKNRVYVLGVASRDKENAVKKQFLENASFLGKTFRKAPKEIPDAEKSVNLESLITTELSKDENSRTNKPISVGNEGSTNRVTIIDNPRPRYSEAARNANLQGKIIARVQFGRNGKIENVEITKSLPFGLDQQAIKAARRIIFLPAQRKGVRYTISKRIQYSFSVY